MVERPALLFDVGKPIEVAIPEIRDLVGEKLPTRTEIGWYRPWQMRNPESPHHGLQHTGETVDLTILGAELAKVYGFTVNTYIAAMSAGYHDIEHPGGDTYDGFHGENAALWVEENLLHLAENRFRIAKSIRAHVPEDMPDIDDTTKVLKDADSLQRVRFGNKSYGLNPKYLRFQHSKELLVPVAIVLHARTNELLVQGFGDGYECAAQALIDIGLAFDR